MVCCLTVPEEYSVEHTREEAGQPWNILIGFFAESTSSALLEWRFVVEITL